MKTISQITPHRHTAPMGHLQMFPKILFRKNRKHFGNIFSTSCFSTTYGTNMSQYPCQNTGNLFPTTAFLFPTRQFYAFMRVALPGWGKQSDDKNIQKTELNARPGGPAGMFLSGWRSNAKQNTPMPHDLRLTTYASRFTPAVNN